MSGGDAEREDAAAARLEQALERIARAARAAAKPPAAEAAFTDRPRLAARLDSVIADLRAALDP